MSDPDRGYLLQQYDEALRSCKRGWEVLRDRGPGKITFWFIALLIGVSAGFAALFFRKGINWIQATLYGTDDVQHLHSFLGSLPWFYIVLIPTFGGLVVGLILHFFTHDARVRSVADVITGAALHNGRVETRAGLASALASLITLSTGGSSGREGPVVLSALRCCGCRGRQRRVCNCMDRQGMSESNATTTTRPIFFRG